MLKRANQIFLVSSFVLTLSFSASAQGNKTQPNTNNPSSTVATNAANTNKPAAPAEREQDGFVGPVRRVKTEVAKLSNKAGKFVEGARTVLENSAYDMKGTKSEYAYFPGAVSAIESTGRETYKYDEKGNISEMTLFNTDGSLAKKEIYIYEYDFLGNWTKMTTSVAVIEGGKLSYEPTEVTFRTISYYVDENVLKQMEAAQKGSSANTASNTNVPASQTQTSSQPTTQPSPPANTDSSAKPNTLNSNHAGSTTTPVSTQTNSGNGENKTANTSSNVEKKTGDTANTNKPENANKTEPGGNSDTSNSPGNTETTKATPIMLRPISGGVLNGKATSLPTPEYPEIARRSRLSGIVIVEVVIDEKGKIISAKAISGPAMLHQSAVNAALRAKFSSTLLSGQPVKVTGTINYNFSMQ